MAVPTQPTTIIPRPFASGGNYAVIPDVKTVTGRASYTEGFPVETQLPIEEGGGGIAPNRLDFNGAYWLCTAFLHWVQSGGQWSYDAGKNYVVPSKVWHNSKEWWCVANNGPDVGVVVEPGTNTAYWEEYITALQTQVPGGGGGGAMVGDYKHYHGTAAIIDGWLLCNGQGFSVSQYPQLAALLGAANVPDLRGEFLRGVDLGRGVDPGRALGTYQGFAVEAHNHQYAGFLYTGAKWGGAGEYFKGAATLSTSAYGTNETRPRNYAVGIYIKHD